MQKQLYETRTIRIFNKCTTHDFMTKLSYETWGNIFDGNYVDSIFNNFHNTFLRIFYSSFSKKKVQVPKKDSSKISWLSKGIKTSINHKRELYLSSRNSNNPKLKEYYKLYCKRLSKGVTTHGLLQNQAAQLLLDHQKLRIHLLDLQMLVSTLFKLRIGSLFFPDTPNLNNITAQHSLRISCIHQD